MGETVGIVLEFLRQHKFEQAEEALLSELQARHTFARPAHQGHGKADFTSCTEASCENCLRNGYGKMELMYHIGCPREKCALFHPYESLLEDLQSKSQGDAPEKQGSIVIHCNQMHGHTEWDFKSCPNQDCLLELKKRGVRSSTGPFESGVHGSTMDLYDGIRPGENELCSMKSSNRPKIIKEYHMIARHEGPGFCQECHQDTHFKSDSLHKQTCERPYMQSSTLESISDVGQQVYKDDGFEKTMGAFELEECSVVREPREIADKVQYTAKAPASCGSVQNAVSSAYDALTESCWLDYDVPDGGAQKFTQPYFLPFPANEGFELQEEKLVVHDCIDYLKNLGLRNQTYDAQFFKDMKLPWEVDAPNGFAEAEVLVNERGPQDCFIVPSSNSGLINADFYLSEETKDGFGFEKILEGQNQLHSNVLFEPSFNLGSFLDIPVGQQISTAGDKCENGIGHLSVCDNAMLNTPELLSGFATLTDEPTNHGVGYSEEYCDSDMYEDDEDPGYERQQIKDEDWFLAHEVNYPSDDEKAKINSGKVADPIESHSNKGSHLIQDKEDSSLFSRKSFSSGSHGVNQAKPLPDSSNLEILIGQSSLNNEPTSYQVEKMSYDGHLMDAEELKMMRTEPVWQALTSPVAEYVLREREEGSYKPQKVYLKGTLGCIDAKLDKTEEVSNWRIASLHEDGTHNFSLPRMGLSHDFQLMHSAECLSQDGGLPSCLTLDFLSGAARDTNIRINGSHMNRDGDVKDSDGYHPGPAGSFLSASLSNHNRDAYNPGDVTPAWVLKSSSQSQHREHYSDDDAVRSNSELEAQKDGILETLPTTTCETRDDGLALDYGTAANELVVNDEERSGSHESLQHMKVEEDEFEIFSLRIIHRKNRTGFEEEKHFQVEINSVVAGRYLITEYLGSAAFSKAVQARDLQTGMDVCMKIIKNNKDFFDQSLDEIKLLKFVNKNDPGDKHHVLRLYDYFYHREHLFIVCELLRANLYEFQKFNRDSGGEAYFTMSRLQLITQQCLEALKFLHCLGLIHCDLKPENILIKSYSRCEIKVIDLGSSCFQSDHLCSYVQSRSYRAPEVILGLPYDEKIDIWSLGCILAELCSGNVLFQNESLANLLARVVGIIGPIMPEMILKGREAHKYFTKSFKLFERNQDSNKLEYLLPKRSSLRHRLPTGDQGFVDFVAYLLQVNPENRPSASEALKHPWLTYPYEPVS